MEKWPRTVYLANIVNLARLHSRVNWYSHCSCEVYSLGTRERVCVSTNLDRSVSSAVVYSRRACGDVFASPSVRQVYGAMKALPSKKTIVIITNCRVLCSPLCVVDYSSLHLHLAADTGDNLRVSRRGRMESRTWIFFPCATMSLWPDRRVQSTVDVRWRAQSSV